MNLMVSLFLWGLLSSAVIHSQTNIAPLGTAYTWAHNLEANADSNKVACPELNDEDPDSVIWLSRGLTGEGIDDIINAWQAAGVVWESAREIVDVVYINGPYDGTVYANGAFSKEESFRLQISRNGTTWEDSEIPADPEYPYFDFNDAAWGALVTDQPFSFKGEIGMVMGVRVAGIVHNWEAGSWNASCRQIMATSNEAVVKNTDEFPISQFVLYQNYPNPFNGGTLIHYNLAQAGTMTLRIFNLTGQAMTTLVNGEQSAGLHSAAWAGRDETGAKVPAGVYFYRLEVTIQDNKVSAVNKMTRLP